jgi:hypothetical protein
VPRAGWQEDNIVISLEQSKETLLPTSQGFLVGSFIVRKVSFISGLVIGAFSACCFNSPFFCSSDCSTWHHTSPATVTPSSLAVGQPPDGAMPSMLHLYYCKFGVNQVISCWLWHITKAIGYSLFLWCNACRNICVNLFLCPCCSLLGMCSYYTTSFSAARKRMKPKHSSWGSSVQVTLRNVYCLTSSNKDVNMTPKDYFHNFLLDCSTKLDCGRCGWQRVQRGHLCALCTKQRIGKKESVLMWSWNYKVNWAAG